MTLNPIIPIARMAMRILTFILLALTITAAYGGYVHPDIWAIPSILTLALPYLAGLTFAAGIIWLACGRFFMAGFAALTIFICWGPISTVSPFGHSRGIDEGEKEFTIASYNILHGIDLQKPDAGECRGLQWVLRSGADIVCLQEFSDLNLKTVPGLTESLADSLKTAYPYRITDPHKGLMLLSKFPAEKISLRDNPFLYDAYSIEAEGRKLTVFNVHLASYKLTDEETDIVTRIKGVRSAKRSVEELKGSVLAKLKQSFRNRAQDAATLRSDAEKIEGPLIICGDFNDVPASWCYRQVMGSDMNDAYTETNSGPMVTYNKHRFLFHIDQMLYRGPLKAVDLSRGNQKNSDHYPLLATFAFTTDSK